MSNCFCTNTVCTNPQSNKSINKRNVSKEITKPLSYEYSKSFRANFRPRSSLIGAS